LAAFLLLASGWSLNIATYNWFAADFPGQNSQAYVSRGNIFFLVALAFFAAFVSIVVAVFCSAKKRRTAKGRA
jgi:hypothetical protein